MLLDSLYFNCTQTQCWYYLKVTHALLMPAVFSCHLEETKQFQENFILAGGVTCLKNMLVKEDFLLNADDNTKKAALLYVFKLNKLTMATVCHAIYSHVLNAVSTKNFSLFNEAQHSHAILLQSSASSIPSSTNEITIRNLAHRLGAQFSSLLINNVPDINHVLKLQRIAWSLAANSTLNLVSSSYEQLHDTLYSNRLNQINESLTNLENVDDVNVCREALECLSLSLCLVPHALESLNQEKHWRIFIVDLVLYCGSRAIRQTASEQFLLIALKCSLQPNRPIQFFIQMLFTCLHSLNKNASQSQEYFYLLCRLLNCANINNVQISNTETLLNNEIAWLKKLKQVNIIFIRVNLLSY
jgi:ubiquitin carboxyl-terminal hydrolase 9/24